MLLPQLAAYKPDTRQQGSHSSDCRWPNHMLLFFILQGFAWAYMRHFHTNHPDMCHWIPKSMVMDDIIISYDKSLMTEWLEQASQ